MIDYNKLRELAAKATQGRWEIKVSAAGQYRIWLYAKNIIRICQFNTQINRHNDAAYIAAANPTVIIELLDKIDALTREAKAGRELRSNLVWSDFSRTHQAIATDVGMYDAKVASTKGSTNE